MLIIRTNGSKSLIGQASLINTALTIPATFASYLIRFRLVLHMILLEWISIYWQSTINRSWIESKAATSAGQYNISMRILGTAPVPLSPLSEQKRIVTEVDSRLSIIHEVENQVDTNLKRAERMRQSILSKVFASRFRKEKEKSLNITKE